jgi:hypothetical protein
MCHAHKNQLDKININQLIAEFVATGTVGATILGKLTKIEFSSLVLNLQ